MKIPPIIPADAELIRQVESMGDGRLVHGARNAIGNYQNALSFANSRAKALIDQGVAPDKDEEFADCLELVEAARGELLKLVARARLR